MLERIAIAQILKPQGVKGELKLKPLTNLSIFEDLKSFFVEDCEVKIEHISIRQSFVFVKLDGYNDRNSVEPLRGKSIYLDRNELEFDNGVYLIGDFLHCDVVTEDGVEMGTIIDVNKYGSADVITIQGKYGTWQFPYLEDVVVNVDIVSKKITINKTRFDEVKV